LGWLEIVYEIGTQLRSCKCAVKPAFNDEYEYYLIVLPTPATPPEILE